MYSDLADVPVLLILIEKGRLGDTFPIGFNSLVGVCERDVCFMRVLWLHM